MNPAIILRFQFLLLALSTYVVKYTSAGGDEELQITDLSQCKYQVEQVGCFKDNVAKRVLVEEVVNSRDKNSKVYMLPDLTGHWKNYPHFLSNLICECAKRVFEENRGQYFGIQYYAECWSGAKDQGNSKDVELDKYGEDDVNCVDSEYQPYDGTKKRCGVYSGKTSANYIYRLKPYTEKACPVFFEQTGCFHDNQVDPRPLPKYLMNERDVTIPNWNGHIIEWNNWDTYMPQLICRCAMAAKREHYTYFGLQFYGNFTRSVTFKTVGFENRFCECWVGNDTASISKDGVAKPNDCLVKLGAEPYGQRCPSKEEQEASKGCLPQLCVGKQLTNQVYELKQGPLGCSNNPCSADQICKPNGSNKFQCIPAEQHIA